MIPATATAAERAFLGLVISEPEHLPVARGMVTVEEFHSPTHRTIWRALHTLKDPAGIIPLHDALEAGKVLEQIGGGSYLAQLVHEHAGTALHLEHYAKAIRHAARVRRIQDLGQQLIEASPSGADVLVAEVRQALQDALLADEAESGFAHQLRDAIRDIAERQDREGALAGTPTGFSTLDNLLSGLCAGDLILLAARPSIGKTAIALNIARNILERGEPVTFVSLEMSSRQLLQRLIATESGVSMQLLRGGGMIPGDMGAMTAAATRLSKWPIALTDRSALSVAEIRAFAEASQREHGKGVIVVDYLGLIRGRDRAENRNLEVAEISRALKAMAKDLGVPVLALCQLSRSPEKRQDKRPALSDLRDSGALEQDADVVLFLHREHIGAEEAELVIAKHRNGPTGTVYFTWDGRHVTFREVAPANPFQQGVA